MVDILVENQNLHFYPVFILNNIRYIQIIILNNTRTKYTILNLY